ncbi:histidine kinase [Fulvivirga sp. M361]|uniref:histidine kinase n=1 Tax=Fulvivirga sp. M361 TaxID=2594266 RepID=UPI00162A30AA|nr:sensor histidine kinase [Fulvivirga sp. M361]
MKSWRNFFWVGSMLLVTSCSQHPVFKQYDPVFQPGDQQEWAAKNRNDQDWKKKIALTDGRVFWSRTKIDILEAPESLHPYGIRLHVYGEYEVFWDGVFIGKNGNPGQEAMLAPEGKMWATFIIPTHLTEKGEHLLAIRSSLHYFPDHVGIFGLEIDYYDDILTDRLIETSYMHIFAGAFLIASFYFLFLFLSDKKEYPMLVFSISCFLFFILILTEFIKAYVPIHYSLHHIRLQVIGILMFGISFLIPFYFSMQFPYPKRKLCLIIYAGILLLIFLIKYDFFDFTARIMALSMCVFSFGIVVFGAYKRIRGARLVLLTLLLCVLINFVTSFDKSLYAGFGLILLSMLYLLSLRIKEQRLAYENSLVQSTRLRLELLKKNIQPHFLMNTLTSLIDWVEESPKKGVLFIEALAKEFDLFNQIENQTLIPVSQEIALCRTHLEIMEYRKEINYSWEEEGIDPEQKIPPGILHTLLENGITHSLPLEGNNIKFKLIFESNAHYKCYKFLTFSRGVRQTTSNREEGTGIKYIKARLNESYHSKWDFTSEATAYGWKNNIKIYC